MKKTLPALIFALGLCTGGAGGAKAQTGDLSALGHRRTLIAPFGEDRLMFEAPRDMCFIEGKNFLESAFIGHIRALTESKGTELYVASFTDCLGLGAIAQQGGLMPMRGDITWLNPYIGEKTSMPRADYLDMREATLAEYLRGDIEKGYAAHGDLQSSRAAGDVAVGSAMSRPGTYTLDAAPRRTEHAVMLGFTSRQEVDYAHYETVSVVGATLIRGFPLDVIMSFTSPVEDGATKDMEDAYALMAEFMAQQVALNE